MHCRAHVLQLCCVSAARCLPSLKKVFATLMSVWKMFHYSPKKFSALKEMQAIINHPQLKMIKHSDKVKDLAGETSWTLPVEKSWMKPSNKYV